MPAGLRQVAIGNHRGTDIGIQIQDPVRGESGTKEFGVRARSHKVDSVVSKLVDQQEVAPDVTFTMVGPFTFQWVIQPFDAER